ncbi:hypothetical protein S40288_11403, partial [Stachybotrys chartarum IBT 40288]
KAVSVESTATKISSVALRDKELDESLKKGADSPQGSKLNPVAPEFTPLKAISHVQPKRVEDGLDEASTKVAANSDGRVRWSDDISSEDEEECVFPSEDGVHPGSSESCPQPDAADSHVAIAKAQHIPDGASSTAQGRRPAPDGTDLSSELANRFQAPEARESEQSVTKSPQQEIVHFKEPRYSRRIQSKSEPSHTSQDSDPVDAAPCVPEDVLRELPTPGQRHVSAPPAKNTAHGPQKSHVLEVEVPTAIPSTTGNDLIPRRVSEVSATHPSTRSKSRRRTHQSGQDDKHEGKSPTVAPRFENVPPSAQKPPDVPAPSRNSRGSRRGKGSWNRGRRGRGGARVASSSKATTS